MKPPIQSMIHRTTASHADAPDILPAKEWLLSHPNHMSLQSVYPNLRKWIPVKKGFAQGSSSNHLESITSP